MSLRDAWPTLTPRERDARVAEALGWTWHTLGAAPRRSFLVAPGSAIHFSGEGDPADWDDSKRARELISEVPPYSTSWEHAGPLLELLRADGWHFQIFSGCPERPYIEVERPAGEGVGILWADGETIPEAIALAFCLAKEGERG